MKELWPRPARQAVFENRFDLFPSLTDFLNCAVRLEIAYRRIKQNQLPGAGDIVMTNDNRVESAGGARRRLGVEHAVGPVRVAPVIADLVCPVRVHRKQKPIKRVRRVGVFPAQIHDSPVGHDSRVPVVFLIEGQLTHSPVRIPHVRICNMGRSANARNAHHRRGRRENDSPVGKITGVVIVDVGMVNRLDFTSSDGFLS